MVKHVSIETSTGVNELLCEAIRMLLRYYEAAGLPEPPHTP